MIEKLIYMDGYGIFVWSSFIFTFVCCLSFYLKTKRELKKQEKMFLSKVSSLSANKVQIIKKQKTNKEILVSSLNFN